MAELIVALVAALQPSRFTLAFALLTLHPSPHSSCTGFIDTIMHLINWYRPSCHTHGSVPLGLGRSMWTSPWMPLPGPLPASRPARPVTPAAAGGAPTRQEAPLGGTDPNASPGLARGQPGGGGGFYEMRSHGGLPKIGHIEKTGGGVYLWGAQLKFS